VKQIKKMDLNREIFHVEKWDDFQSFSGSKLMTGSIEQEGTVEDRHLNSPSGVSEGLTNMEQEPTLQKDDLQKDSLQKPSEADYRDGKSDFAAKAQGNLLVMMQPRISNIFLSFFSVQNNRRPRQQIHNNN